MSHLLIESLINEKISLNEFKDWINLSSNEEKLLETTKYELITNLLSNIHLSTEWLTKVLPQNCNQINTNSRHNSLNNSPIKLSFNESHNKSDDKIISDLNEEKLIKLKNRKITTIRELTKKVETFDLRDETLFPTLSSGTIVSNNAKTNTLSENCISTNSTTVLCRRKRRIKPTTIKDVGQQIPLGFFSNSRDSKGKPIRKEWIRSTNNENISDIKSNNNIINSESNDSLKAEREWLKRAKTETSNDLKTQNMDSIKVESHKLVTIEANPHSVSFSNQLKVISNIYVTILKSNFVPNFFDELKFICELVTKRVTQEFNEDIIHQLDSIFCSYHNCIYFSVNVLEDLLLNNGLINCLNKTTLKQLTESSNIMSFSSVLKGKLLSVIESHKPINKDSNNFKTTLESVLFQSETDNKCNFPNDQSFHSFRKQRDEFYQIYNNFRQDINDNKDSYFKFVNSIKHLFSLSRDSGNMSHLSRLFVSQLLQSCVNRQLSSQNIDSNEETTDENETVRKLMPDKEKLKKLQKRFNKSSSTLSDSNLFSKNELFFRDFIFYADSHAFNEHLKLLLSDKLLEFNSNQILNFETDLNEIQVLSNRLKNSLISLKIISKFLAYLTFYPFDTTLFGNKQEFITSQTRLRSQSKPLIDLEKCLREAIDKKQLLLTIPWIVEFLSFIDPISIRTFYYENIYYYLVIIYKSYLPKIIEFVPTNGLFILFSVTKILCDKYFNDRFFYEIVFNAGHEIPNITPSEDSLDFMIGLIDNEFIDEFYPQFNNELTQIFKQNVVNEVRKITPLTMSSIDRNKQMIHKKSVNNGQQLLRLQIEEQFFNTHSPSLKKSVDFVSDRIISKCIKKIKSETFIQLKQPYIESFDSQKTNIYDITITIQNECKNFIKSFCEPQIRAIFPLLVNEDIDESVLQFSIKITNRLTIDKCFEWIDNNITQSLIENDLKTELDKRKTETNEEKHELKVEDKEVIDISSTFNSIRDLMADLYDEKSITDISIIVKLVNELSHLKRSKTLPQKTLDFIDVNIVDFAIALIANQPKLVNDLIIKLFIDYWLEFNIIVGKFICPRNLYILFKCKTPLMSWSKFESFLINMLSKRIITTQIIENDSLWTLKEEWNDSVLNRFASCLKSVVIFNQTNGNSDNTNDMLNIIDWLSWFCSQSDQ